jgi:WD40 repeat protein
MMEDLSPQAATDPPRYLTLAVEIWFRTFKTLPCPKMEISIYAASVSALMEGSWPLAQRIKSSAYVFLSGELHFRLSLLITSQVWDIASRSIQNHFTGHEQDIYSLDFARNGRMIASGSGDHTVRLWDIESNQQICMLSIEDGVTTVAISPDNRLVAAGSLDKNVRVWDTVNGTLLERLEGEVGHADSVYSVAFAPNGRDLVSGSLDKTIKMWELTKARGLPAVPNGKCVRTFQGHKVSYHHHLRGKIIFLVSGQLTDFIRIGLCA